jgi:undecaprenyl-phosphate galactose phosphotransferase
MRKNNHLIKKNIGIALLFLIDFASVVLLLKGAILVRVHLMPYFLQFPEFPQRGVTFFWWIFPVWLFFFVYEGLYSKRFSFWDEVKTLWKISFFSTLGVFSILFLGKIGEQVSRTVIVLMGILSIPFLPILRLLAKKVFHTFGLLKGKAIILGAGYTGRLIFDALMKDKNLGMHVVGFLDDDPQKIGDNISGVRIHGGVNKARKYIGRCGIEDVVIAMPGCDREKLLSIVNDLQHETNNVLLIPDLFGLSVLGTNLQHFFQEQAIGLEIRNNLAQPANKLIKKVFDMIVGSLLLVFLAIPMMIISFLIRVDSKGPAIFLQDRIGRNNKRFRCYKFRTMYIDAEERLQSLLVNDEQASKEWEKRWKLEQDPRITKIGKLLRQSSLDELPQIFNVLKGEMSLVGPRPVTQEEIDKYYKEQSRLYFGVPPGITGLWQVSGRSNTTYDHRIALDSWYVRNWNLWLDIVILFKTVKVVLKMEGAV